MPDFYDRDDRETRGRPWERPYAETYADHWRPKNGYADGEPSYRKPSRERSYSRRRRSPAPAPPYAYGSSSSIRKNEAPIGVLDDFSSILFVVGCVAVASFAAFKIFGIFIDLLKSVAIFVCMAGILYAVVMSLSSKEGQRHLVNAKDAYGKITRRREIG